MILRTLFSTLLFSVVPRIALPLKVLGAAYMRYLAWKTLMPPGTGEQKRTSGSPWAGDRAADGDRGTEPRRPPPPPGLAGRPGTGLDVSAGGQARSRTGDPGISRGSRPYPGRKTGPEARRTSCRSCPPARRGCRSRRSSGPGVPRSSGRTGYRPSVW